MAAAPTTSSMAAALGTPTPTPAANSTTPSAAGTPGGTMTTPAVAAASCGAAAAAAQQQQQQRGVLIGERLYSGVRISLENCVMPAERLAHTPSSYDRLEAAVETELRELGCELVQAAGILLRLPQVAMATGQVLFQRFYYSKSFIKHNMEVVAMSCVNLAAKIEEAPRRNRDVINVFHHLRQLRTNRVPSPLTLDQGYINTKNELIKSERRILKELGFCVHVKHPHKIIVVYLQVLECHKNQPLVQTAWNYMNDSLRTNVFVRYSPETIACACIYLSARTLQIPLPGRPPWFSLFGADEADLQDICLAILQLYNRRKPSLEHLESCVERCRVELQELKLRERGFCLEPNPGTPGRFSPASKPASPRDPAHSTTTTTTTASTASAATASTASTSLPPSLLLRLSPAALRGAKRRLDADTAGGGEGPR
ncbi:cyclin-L1, partial [Petromyzon marinus]|uniref:cyclin-L1 n=1 Tax=Petromyzon marinus TaxID=7757 RepID=UPI003F710F20